MIIELVALNLSEYDEPSDQERCAVLIRTCNGTIIQREVPNRHPRPHTNYVIHKSDADAVLMDGDVIVGAMHTHTRHKGLSYADVVKMPDGMIGLMYRPLDRSRIIYNNKGPLHVVAGERRR